MRSSRRVEVLFGLGCLIGILLAAKDIVAPGGAPAPLAQGVLATVNGVAISEAEYRTLARLASEDAGDGEIEPATLNRMIEEELLLQQAKTLGIERGNNTLRRGLIQAMVDSIVAEARAAEPSEQDLLRFYEANPELLARMTRVWIREIRFPFVPDRPAGNARQSALLAIARLGRGEDLHQVVADLGEPPSPIRDELVSTSQVREYYGPSVAARVLALAEGEISPPLRTRTAYHVVMMVEHGEPEVLPFKIIRHDVLAAYRRHEADAALRRYIDAVWADSDVTVSAP